MVETALYRLGVEDYDKLRIVYATRTFVDWYKGDGLYGDGAAFHWDYYNSFVIQPMYVDIVKTFAPIMDEIAVLEPTVQKRATRYASILERLIGQDWNVSDYRKILFVIALALSSYYRRHHWSIFWKKMSNLSRFAVL